MGDYSNFEEKGKNESRKNRIATIAAALITALATIVAGVTISIGISNSNVSNVDIYIEEKETQTAIVATQTAVVATQTAGPLDGTSIIPSSTPSATLTLETTVTEEADVGQSTPESIDVSTECEQSVTVNQLNTENANVRRGPSTDFDSVTVTYEGDVWNLIKLTPTNDGGWYQIQKDGITGWILAGLVNVETCGRSIETTAPFLESVVEPTPEPIAGSTTQHAPVLKSASTSGGCPTFSGSVEWEDLDGDIANVRVSWGEAEFPFESNGEGRNYSIPSGSTFGTWSSGLHLECTNAIYCNVKFTLYDSSGKSSDTLQVQNYC